MKITRLILGLCFIAINFQSNGQADFDRFLEAGQEDANKLLESYFEPFFIGMGSNVNSGWINTAKPHKLLGFDLTVTASASFIPTDAEFFTFNNSDFQNVKLSEGSSDELPTMMGPNLAADDIPELTYFNDGEEVVRSTAPTGLGIEDEIGFNAVPIVMPQLGIGLFKNTELKFRFVPETTIEDDDGDGKIKMLGFGVLHDVKQWIPGIKLLPFDLSLFAGYTTLDVEVPLDEDFPDRIGTLELDALNIEAIVSKKFSVLTAYASLGYSNFSNNVSLLGTYETESEVFTNPIDLDFSSSSFKGKLGLRVKLLILTIQADYTIQEYNTFSTGVGISFR